MIAIIDYGMGNLASVKNALASLGFASHVTSDPDQVVHAPKVILPGVGAFADCLANLHTRGMDQAICEAVKRDTPLLGICLGMQLLFTESEENGLHQGLGLLAGRVVRFNLPASLKVPHMGWNSIVPSQDSRLLRGINPESYFYFVHSYFPVVQDSSVVAARCRYGEEFACAVEQGNLFATQFHPEKSGAPGLRILKNFGEL